MAKETLYATFGDIQGRFSNNLTEIVAILGLRLHRGMDPPSSSISVQVCRAVWHDVLALNEGMLNIFGLVMLRWAAQV
jgi:hypothetical protein